jgi:hypothetical protein
MNRRAFLSMTALASLGFAGVAHAQTSVDRISSVLRSEGYRNIEASRTLLGRVRITAERAGFTREIILNPRSGEILRDILFTTNGEAVRSGSFDYDDGSDDADDGGNDGDDGGDSGGDDGGDDGGDGGSD